MKSRYLLARSTTILTCCLTAALLMASPATVRAEKYVSPTGNDANPGTLALPYKTLAKAISVAGPDSLITMRGGVFTNSARLTISRSGTAGHPIRVWAFPGELPVMDFAGEPSPDDGISLTGGYLHFKGIDVRFARQYAIKISGSNNIIEACRTHDNRNTGVYITGGGSNNLILNCDSYFNFNSPVGANADGFGVATDVGTGNVFRGCRSYNNSDDGWGLWAAVNPVLLDSCWSFRNGVDSWHTGSVNGNGMGFRLGGSRVPAPNTVRNCVAFDNAGNTGTGFDENNNLAGQTLYNCTAFRNKGDNFHFINALTSGSHVIRNNVSYLGTVNITSGTRDHNSWQGFTVTDGDFAGLDTAQALAPRTTNGSLPDISLLHLSSGSPMIDAGVNVGLPYNGTAPDLGAFESLAVQPPAVTGFTPSGGFTGDAATITGLRFTGATSVKFNGTSAAFTVNLPTQITATVPAGATTGPISVTTAAGTGASSLNFTVQFRITASAGSNGSISPGGDVTVDDNGAQTFAIAPATGYHVDSVFVDGAYAGAVTSYAFTGVNANHTINAKFAVNRYSLTASAGANGSIAPSGTTTVNYGGSQSYALTPATGYHVADVLVDGSSIGAVSTYSFSGVTANHTISVSFGVDQFTIAASAAANGSIAPSGATTVNYGGSQSYALTPATGYHVVDVLVDGSSIGAVTNYSFSGVTANHTISASFAVDQFTITASAGPDGSIAPSGVTTVNYGGSQSYALTPATGYHVADVLVDGSSIGAVTNYSFPGVTANHTISASFALDQFTISASAGANGSIAPSGAATVNYGVSQAYSITPATGFHVADVLVDGSSIGAVTNYSFSGVTANHTIIASFAVDLFTINAGAGAGGSIEPAGVTTVSYGAQQGYAITSAPGYHVDSVLVDGGNVGAVGSYDFTNVVVSHTIFAKFAVNIYTITASGGPNGTITPAGATTVNYGASQGYSITPATGYHVADVLVDGSSIGAVTSYSFTDVAASHTISASFAVDQFAITASAGANGSIAPAGVTSVNYGGDQNYTITPAPGYHVADVLVDGSSIGAVSTWSFTGVTALHSISASFAVDQYTITASAGPNGSITPAGITTVNSGDSLRYAIVPDAGYAVASVSVDGSPVGAVTTYLFTNVTSAHTIDASFAVLPKRVVSNGTGGGVWAAAATWTGGVVPAGIDTAVIRGTDTVGVNAAGASCAVLIMTGGSKLSLNLPGMTVPGLSWALDPGTTIQYNATTTVQTAVAYANLVYNTNASGSMSGNLTVNGNLTITQGTLRGNSATSGQLTHTIAGNVIVGPGTAAKISAVNNSSATTAYCTWNIGGTLALTGGTSGNRMIFYESAGPHTGLATYNVDGDIVIAAGAQIQVRSSTSASTGNVGTANINLKGNFFSAGTIGTSTGGLGTTILKMKLIGTSPQHYRGLLPNAFPAGQLAFVQIANEAGVSLDTATTINANVTLAFSAGKLTTTSVNLLTQGAGSISIASPSSYINGPLAVSVAAGSPAPFFPIGDENAYTPVTVAFGTVTAPGTVRASTTSGLHPQIAGSGLSGSKLLGRYYTLTSTATVFDTYTATLNFAAGDVMGGADPTKFVVRKNDGGVWTSPATANAQATSIQATGMTSMSDFAVGEPQNYAITAFAAANGTIAPDGETTVSYGGNQTYTIAPAVNYHVASVLVDGSSVGAVTAYSFTGVTASHTISASFALDEFTITASAGTGGTITPSGAVSVTVGGSQAFAIATNTGYHIADVLVDGSSIGPQAGYTFNGVTTGHSISAAFARDQFTITASAGAHGAIVPSGATTVSYDDSLVYAIAPAMGYHVADVLVDGSSAGTVTSYGFLNISGNHTISASFAINTFAITATAGANGSIAPAGVSAVNYGDSLLFTISAEPGYHADSVVVDGGFVGAVNSYWFRDVSADHAIRATFAAPRADTTTFPVNVAWNLVSVPREPVNGNAYVLFPGAAAGSIYSFRSGTYTRPDTLASGEGYWGFFTSGGMNRISGSAISSASLTLTTGNRWVLIGSVTPTGVPVANLTSDPAGSIIPGSLYGYSGSMYTAPSTVEPGRGYWVYISVPCTLTISAP